MRYTDWVALEDVVDAPVDSGLFQVKVRDCLLSYPSGKSAMYYYGFAANLKEDVQRFKDEFVPILQADAMPLMVRWMAVADVQQRFRKHLNFFHENFGSLPAGNELWLQRIDSAVKNPTG